MTDFEAGVNPRDDSIQTAAWRTVFRAGVLTVTSQAADLYGFSPAHDVNSALPVGSHPEAPTLYLPTTSITVVHPDELATAAESILGLKADDPKVEEDVLIGRFSASVAEEHDIHDIDVDEELAVDSAEHGANSDEPIDRADGVIAFGISKNDSPVAVVRHLSDKHNDAIQMSAVDSAYRRGGPTAALGRIVAAYSGALAYSLAEQSLLDPGRLRYARHVEQSIGLAIEGVRPPHETVPDHFHPRSHGQ